jgi:hypothetical protein
MAAHDVEMGNELRHVLMTYFVFWFRVRPRYYYYHITMDSISLTDPLSIVTVMGAFTEARSRAVRGIDRTSQCHVPGQTIGTKVIVPWARAQFTLVDLEMRDKASVVEGWR